MAESEEKKKVLYVFSMYSKGEDTIDAADVIDAVRALDLNPTQALVISLGGCENRGETRHKFEDFWKIYEGVKTSKDQGGFADFVECLKIYDIDESGFMSLGELSIMLLSLGEKISQEQLDQILLDCQLEEVNEEGWFPYLPFLCRLCGKPLPKDFKPV